MFVFPHGATVDREGNLWVTDARAAARTAKIGHQVFKFSPDGKVLMTLGSAGVSGSGPDLFDQPTDVVVCAERRHLRHRQPPQRPNNRVVKFTADGRFMKEWGRKGAGPGELSEPHTIAMDSRGRLFVGDRENNRISSSTRTARSSTSGGSSAGRAASTSPATTRSTSPTPSPGPTPARASCRASGRASASAAPATARSPRSSRTWNRRSTDHSGAEGVGVDAQGNVYGAVVRRQMLERYTK